MTCDETDIRCVETDMKCVETVGMSWCCDETAVNFRQLWVCDDRFDPRDFVTKRLVADLTGTWFASIPGEITTENSILGPPALRISG